jgi:hypothetical protein
MGWAPRLFVKQVVAIERRSNMLAEDMELQGMAAAVAPPDWLRGLIRALHHEAMQPKDARVKSLWDLLRQRQLLGRSPWVRAMLHRIWDRGLVARPRPRLTHRLVRRLRRWGILPPARPAAQHPVPIRTLQPVAAQPIRPVAVQPIKPVAIRPTASMAPRR